jgi:hypothetical protein
LQRADASSGFAADARQGNENYDENADASYSFAIDTDSYKRTESSDAKGNIRGQYSYNSQAGGSHGVSYIAGEGIGFVVTGGDSAAKADSRAGPFPSNVYAPLSSPDHSRGPAADTRSSLNNDGSYSFSFSTDDQSREESADSQNNVRGSYSFKAKDDGRTRRVDYTAGSATGFVATGSHLPVPPPPSGNTVLFGYSSAGQPSPESFRQSSSSPFSQSGHPSYSATDGIQRQIDYAAGDRKVSAAKDAFSLALTSGRPTSFGESSRSSGLQRDGSYAFSYNAGDHSRQESGDAQNNVKGSYSFVAKDDGQTRHVEYEAGAGTGFVAKGTHLPVAPSPSDAAGDHYSYSSHPSGSSYSAGTGFIAEGPHLPVRPSVLTSGLDATGVGYSQSFASSPSTGSDNAMVQKGSDGSYSFSYNAGDHSREESSDDRGNIRGKYSFIAKEDGKAREVVYEAGAEKGFIAKGAHIPVSGAARTFGGAFAHQSSSAPGSFGSTSDDFSRSASPASQAVAVGSLQGDQSIGDASYSYSYQTDSSGKQESSDAQGNVVGRYSYLGGDGVTRNVHYTSRGDEGFVVSDENIPAVTAVASAAFDASSIRSAGARFSHTKSIDVGPDNFRIKTFLPPGSPRKFGYIFDTKI